MRGWRQAELNPDDGNYAQSHRVHRGRTEMMTLPGRREDHEGVSPWRTRRTRRGLKRGRGWEVRMHSTFMMAHPGLFAPEMRGVLGFPEIRARDS